ncbi:MAG: hypothetical protein DWQ44_03325 [Bacteroidetes bacterium]|nr:MAG: hypothetical protein DWQ33_04480 [Bacteroidota bacterium]REJ99971.1 MAG: hypothetical protein DWQ39_13750 [Bacteroidota bacterium]REK35849.1 MAG: hypothetical protein DWQ44_03325 [Bacteroidota bacterium]REK50674.1 MAG: hypothetical protein DWQ48_05040 [Bacteroidota bacterium]
MNKLQHQSTSGAGVFGLILLIFIFCLIMMLHSGARDHYDPADYPPYSGKIENKFYKGSGH